MAKTVTIKPSLKEVTAKIMAVIADPASRRRVLIRAVLELKDLAAGYPVAGPWNSNPGTKGNGVWYQRGFGTRYQRADGSIGGKNTSQRLQKSWATEVQQGNEFTASAFTGVTYAPYLLDADQQVKWAPIHGWKTTDEIADEYAPRFEKIALDEIDSQINKI